MNIGTLADAFAQQYMSSVHGVDPITIHAQVHEEVTQALVPLRSALIPKHWTEARHEAQDVTAEAYIDLTSIDMDRRTLKRRIARFLDPDDYEIIRGSNGRKIYRIKADMIGWVTRRLY